jgi:FMN phosphatase YigB (HAD superfamily)
MLILKNRCYSYFLVAIICLFAFTTAPVYANPIIETDRIEDLLQHIDKNTLVVFDLDNTLIEPHQTLGSDQWFVYHFEKTKESLGKENRHALIKAVDDYEAVHRRSDVRLIDPHIHTVFKYIKNQDIKILGLTSRGARLRESTIRQLQSVGLSFDAPWNDHDYHYPLEKAKHGGNAHGGIVLTAGAHKGECLLEYLDHLDYKPTRVVFIDDRAEHLSKVKSSLESRQIPFMGIRYTYLDDKVKAFDPHVAAIQLEHLHKIISDEDAKAILEARLKQRPSNLN